MVAVVVLLLVVAAFWGGLQVGRSVRPAVGAATAVPELAAAEESLRLHRAFQHHLRELVWQHRELDPDLATIALDEFRRFEQDPGRWAPPSGGGPGSH